MLKIYQIWYIFIYEGYITKIIILKYFIIYAANERLVINEKLDKP